jgi:hypothetical protein
MGNMGSLTIGSTRILYIWLLMNDRRVLDPAGFIFMRAVYPDDAPLYITRRGMKCVL